MYCSEINSKESIKEKIYASFDRYNKKSQKAYNITVSIGAVKVDAEQEMTLEEALAKADEKLYEAKKLRKKEVAKNI